MNRKQYIRNKREWAREHAEDVVDGILTLPGSVAYVEIFSDFSGVLRDDDDQYIAGFESAEELVVKLNELS